MIKHAIIFMLILIVIGIAQECSDLQAQAKAAEKTNTTESAALYEQAADCFETNHSDASCALNYERAATLLKRLKKNTTAAYDLISAARCVETSNPSRCGRDAEGAGDILTSLEQRRAYNMSINCYTAANNSTAAERVRQKLASDVSVGSIYIYLLIAAGAFVGLMVLTSFTAGSEPKPPMQGQIIEQRPPEFETLFKIKREDE